MADQFRLWAAMKGHVMAMIRQPGGNGHMVNGRSWVRNAARIMIAMPIFFANPALSQGSGNTSAATAPEPVAASVATYADVAGLLEKSAIVARVEIRQQVALPLERQVGVAPGKVRLYLNTRTESLLVGKTAVGESLAFLSDVPLGAKAKPPKLKKQRFVVFAVPVAGRAGELQLVGPEAMLPASPMLEQQIRTIATALLSPDAPPAVTGVRDVMSVRGNLAGESETQMFLDTAGGAPVSLTVIRRPGMQPDWGVSWTEIVDQSAAPPRPETLEWYRLACSLPPRLPANAFLQAESASRFQAEVDYEFVLQQLGPCTRLLG